MKSIILLLTLFIASKVFAKHLGTFGETFSIVEEDLLEAMQAKLNNLVATGSILEHQTKIQNMIMAGVRQPTPVEGLIKTKTAKVFWYDPSIKVPYDLTDHRGRIFVVKDTTVNPLDFQQLRNGLVFIDGNDKAQATWAKALSNNHKIILVNGSPFEFMEQHKITCYFDQGGKLINKFGIKQIPARVIQDGKQLKIEEVLLDE